MAKQPLHVQKIEKMGSSRDGARAVLHLRFADGTDQMLAFPSSLLGSLLRLTASVTADAQRLAGGQQSSTAVERWKVQKSTNGETILLSFQVPGGAELAFNLPTGAASLFCDALEASLGRLSSGPGGAMKH